MKHIEQSRIVEGLTYKTLVGRNGFYSPAMVVVLKVTPKTVTYMVGTSLPETNRLGKYKTTFDLPKEAEAEDLQAYEAARTREQNLHFLRHYLFTDLDNTQLTNFVELLKSLKKD